MSEESNSTWTPVNEDCENCGSSNVSDDYSSFDCTEGLGYRASVIFSRPASVLAVVLVIFAIVANALSLLAISQVRMRLTGHLRLVISLASSDMLIGISVVLFLFNKVVFHYFQPGEGPRHCRRRFWCVFVFVKALNSTSLNMTLLNLMAMATDHYLAILRPLHHQSMMNKTRAKIVLICLWIIAMIAGFSDYLYAIPRYKRVVSKFTFCEVVYLSPYNEEYLTFAISFVAFVQMLYCYIRICVRIKQRERCMLVRQNGLHVQLKYNTRGLITTILIVGTFVLCWLPMCLFQVALIIKVKTDYQSVVPLLAKLNTIDQYLYDLHLINAICDPIIYAVRMSEVKLGYRRLFWRVCRFRIRPPNNDSYAQSSRFLEHRLSGRASSSRNGQDKSSGSGGPCPMSETHLNADIDSWDKTEKRDAYKGHKMTRTGSIFFE